MTPSILRIGRGLLLAAALSLPAACGPAEITAPGTTADEEYNARISRGLDANDSLRPPLSGKAERTDRLFYNLNRSESMDRFQDKAENRLMGGSENGMAISPEDPRYRSIPQQRSPFRQ